MQMFISALLTISLSFADYKTAGNFEIEIIKNVAYKQGDGADPVRHRLDLYLPKGKKDFPVLMFVHGGAWKFGNKDLYEALGKVYAKNGIGTVIINYRLSPQVKHPEHIRDVAKAFSWVHANIGSHGGDRDELFLCGHSAGGHLVSLLATNETYLKEEKLTTAAIKGVIAMSGVYTIVPVGALKGIFTADPAVVQSASPLSHVTGQHPPFLILYAQKDYATLDLMAEAMCKKLKDCQCDATVMKIADRDHISIITSMAKESDPTNQAIFEFLAKYGGLKLKAAPE
jgi:acetyl esterase/lipase